MNFRSNSYTISLNPIAHPFKFYSSSRKRNVVDGGSIAPSPVSSNRRNNFRDSRDIVITSEEFRKSECGFLEKVVSGASLIHREYPILCSGGHCTHLCSSPTELNKNYPHLDPMVQRGPTPHSVESTLSCTPSSAPGSDHSQGVNLLVAHEVLASVPGHVGAIHHHLRRQTALRVTVSPSERKTN
ncbi:hypothetical protein CEXT_190501, partial [Caerostris extrusa]